MPKYTLTVEAPSGDSSQIDSFMQSTKDLLDSHWNAQLDKSND